MLVFLSQSRVFEIHKGKSVDGDTGQQHVTGEFKGKNISSPQAVNAPGLPPCSFLQALYVKIVTAVCFLPSENQFRADFTYLFKNGL